MTVGRPKCWVQKICQEPQQDDTNFDCYLETCKKPEAENEIDRKHDKNYINKEKTQGQANI